MADIKEAGEKIFYEKAEIMDASSVSRAITRISFEIIERNKGVDNVFLIGLLSRGFFIAQRIANKIDEVEHKKLEVGMLDITPFRDDLTHENCGDNSHIPFDVTDKKIIIIDDVIYTGRSARAAIDAIMTRGRPKSIQLAVLVDRGHRELPIRADYVGKNLPTASDEIVRVMVQEKDDIDRVAIFENKVMI